MRKLFKTIIALSLTAIMCICPAVSNASSEMIAHDYAGTCDWLVAVKNPATISSTTSTKTFVLSAVAIPGAIITIYNFNPQTNLYEKVYVEGEALETTVGASGLYAQQITLAEGVNNLLIYATNGFDDQATRLDINLISEGFIDKIKSFTIDFTNIF